MDIKMEITLKINKLKTKLKVRAKKEGIYPNFGQREVGELYNEYSHDDRVFVLISKFNRWCMEFESNLRGS